MDRSANKGELSRNTVAVGIVVLHHLRLHCPVEPSEVLSARGEIKGARSGLSAILGKYGIPASYLKEVTTRAGHQDGQRLLERLKYGAGLANIPVAARDRSLQEAIELLVALAHRWLNRQHLKVNCDRQLSPAAWIQGILGEAKSKSGGKVEQHLVGAKLAVRFPDEQVPNHPSHAGDVQTGRAGDFVLGSTCYHVTAAPGGHVVEKCKANLGAGLHPVLLAPRGEPVTKARHLAEDKGIADRITVLAIEDFIALNIIEMSMGEQREFVGVLRKIIEKYNKRLEEVETDLSLKIEIA